jgi:hypothetical protein
MLILAVFTMLVIFSSPVALADVLAAEHGGTSKCYNCHVANYPTDQEAGVLHNMTSTDAWNSCTDTAACHLNLNASGTVHSAVNCKGCHAPIHVSMHADGAGGWMYVYRVNTSDIVSKPTLPITWDSQTYYFNSGNDTTLLGTAISGMGGEVHWAWTNISGVAAGISSSTRYLMCFNCHFITTNPAEAGLVRMIDGQSMIAIPEFALRLSPHSITDSALKEAASGSELVALKSDNIGTASGLIIGIGIIGLALWRRKKP